MREGRGGGKAAGGQPQAARRGRPRPRTAYGAGGGQRGFWRGWGGWGGPGQGGPPLAGVGGSRERAGQPSTRSDGVKTEPGGHPPCPSGGVGGVWGGADGCRLKHVSTGRLGRHGQGRPAPGGQAVPGGATAPAGRASAPRSGTGTGFPPPPPPSGDGAVPPSPLPFRRLSSAQLLTWENGNAARSRQACAPPVPGAGRSPKYSPVPPRAAFAAGRVPVAGSAAGLAAAFPSLRPPARARRCWRAQPKRAGGSLRFG